MISGRNDFLQQKLNNLRSQVQNNRNNQNYQRSFTPNITNVKYQFTQSEVQQPYEQSHILQENYQQNRFTNDYTNNIWQQSVQPKIVYAKNGITSLHLKNNKKQSISQLPINSINKRRFERVSQIKQPQQQNFSFNEQKRRFAKSVDYKTSRMLNNNTQDIQNFRELSRRSGLSPDRQVLAHNQLCDKHELMIETNIKLEKDIYNLKERVKRGNEELKFSDVEYLKEIKYQEDQFEFAKNKFQDLQEKLTQINFQIQRENNRKSELQKVLPEYLQENKLLKQEASKYVEIAGQDILDMENNLNKLGRLRQMYKENFNMEKQKKQNDIEFQEENFKNMFQQKKQQKDDQIDKIQYEKKKVMSNIFKMQEELKNFNYEANQKIKNVMMEVMDENEAKQNLQYQNYIQQIEAEDEQCNIIKNLNEQMHQELENNSKKNNSYQVQYKNRKIYLIEEMQNLQHLLEKMHLEFNNQESKQESDLIYIEELKQEIDEMDRKTNTLKENYKDQIIQFSQQHDQEIDELKMQVREFEEIQYELARQIQNQKALIDQDNEKMNEIVDDQYNRIKNTLSEQLINVHHPLNQNVLQWLQ